MQTSDPEQMSRLQVPDDAAIEQQKIYSGKKRTDGTKIMRGLTPSEIAARKRERDDWVESIRLKIHSIEE